AGIEFHVFRVSLVVSGGAGLLFARICVKSPLRTETVLPPKRRVQQYVTHCIWRDIFVIWPVVREYPNIVATRAPLTTRPSTIAGFVANPYRRARFFHVVRLSGNG